MAQLIDYKGVEIHQADQIVLHDVNLSVQSGEMIYLLGKVGAGLRHANDPSPQTAVSAPPNGNYLSRL